MSFRLVPKSVTLNDLERRNDVILCCFSEFGYLPGALRKSSRSLSHLLMSSCTCNVFSQLHNNFTYTSVLLLQQHSIHLTNQLPHAVIKLIRE